MGVDKDGWEEAGEEGGLDSDDNKIVSEYFVPFFSWLFDTSVCFIVFTGFNPHNTLRGECRTETKRRKL